MDKLENVKQDDSATPEEPAPQLTGWAARFQRKYRANCNCGPDSEMCTCQPEPWFGVY